MTYLLRLVACLFLCASLNSFGAFIERDFLVTGDGLLTYDTINQREWLDLSLTKGMSLNDFNNDQGGYLSNSFELDQKVTNAEGVVTQDYYGYFSILKNEIMTGANHNYGSSDISDIEGKTFSDLHDTETQNYINLLSILDDSYLSQEYDSSVESGSLEVNNYPFGTEGFLYRSALDYSNSENSISADALFLDAYAHVLFEYHPDDSFDFGYEMTINTIDRNIDCCGSDLYADGLFLSRPVSPVPLPAGIYLFLSGLVGLGLMRGSRSK